jgi:DNA helicase-2/ATP-dependent DNA helicase PcrA
VLSAFLAHLSAAEDEEHGLDTGAVSGADTVKLMTVHAAKGLEWPVVAVPGLACSTGRGAAVFPARPSASTSWTANFRLLPFPLRGDRADLPALRGLEPEDLTAHLAAVADRDAREERRLAYVAVTRAERLLLCSGYHWGEGATVVGPSVFLEQARAACLDGAGTVVTWAQEPPEVNPVVGTGRAAPWPSASPPAGPAVQAAATRVRSAAGRARRRTAAGRGSPRTALAGGRGPLGRRPPAPRRGGGPPPARRTTSRCCPRCCPVTGLVELEHDPAALARSLLRPLPGRRRR